MLLCTASPGNAQLNIAHLSTSEGLSQGMIMCMLQDKEGFLWVGTLDGLNRYDGYKFKIYRHNPADSHSISGNTINTLFEDNRGLIWIGVDNGGLNCYDKRTGHFTNITSKMPKQVSDGLGIIKIIETTSGSYLLAKEADLFEMVIPQEFPAQVGSIARVSITKLDQLHNTWVKPGYTQKVLKLDPFSIGLYGNGKLKKYDFRTKALTDMGLDAYLTINNDNETPLWADSSSGSIWSLKEGVLYELKEGKVLSSRVLQFEGLPNGDQKCIGVFRDANHVFYFNYAKGFAAIGQKDLGIMPAQYQPITPKGQIGNIVFGSQKRVWMGTNGYGIFSCIEGGLPFKKIGNLSAYRFSAMNNGNLFVQAPDFQTSQFKVPFFLRQFDEKKIYSYGNQTKMLGVFAVKQTTENHDCFFYSDNKYNLTIYLSSIQQQKFQVPLKLNHLDIQILIDRKDNVWMTPEIGKLVCKWKDKDSFTTYNLLPLLGPQANFALVRQLYEAGDGSLWLSTEQGLLHLNINQKGIIGHQLFQNQPNNPLSLGINQVLSVMEDPSEPNKYLWLGTRGGGLEKMDIATGNCTHYTTKEGLPNNVVYGVLRDHLGRLWLSTNNGLSCFIPQKGFFHNFTEADGLQDNEFNTGSFYKHKDGRLFFGGVSGINIIEPKEVQFDTSFTPIFFTSLKINNQVVDFKGNDDILHTPLEYTKTINLNYKQNFINLSFAATNFKKLGVNIYRYRMDGIDKDWVYADSRNEVSYPNLPPGSYTLLVTNANENGDWNPAVTTISFIISPPWWRTTLAYGLYVLGAVFAIYLLFYFQLRRINLKNELALKANELAFKDKEARQLLELDEFKNRFFTNITHELRTPLTLIVEPARILLADNQLKDSPIVQAIFNNSLRLLRLVNNLLDISKLEAGKMTLHFAEGDIVPLVKAVMDSFFVAAQQQKIQLQFNAFPNTIIASVDKPMLEKITHNLLSNAIKFTPSGGTITVSIAAQGATFWTLEVADTGIGIPENQLSAIFSRFYQVDNSSTRRGEGTGIGLALVKELVDQVNGSIKVSSKPGQGTLFSLQFPTYPNIAETNHQAMGEEKETADIHKPSLITDTPGQSIWTTPEIVTQASANRNNNPNETADEVELSVLVVEDNDELRVFISMILQQIGYAVYEAANGQEGIDKAIELIPTIIISDLMMPLKDGYELVHELKNNINTSHIPIVLLTAKQSLEAKLKGYQTGADAYLSKPFHSQELQIRMQQLLDARRRMQQRFQQEGERPHTETTEEEEAVIEANLEEDTTLSTDMQPIALSTLDAQFLQSVDQLILNNLQKEDLVFESIATQMFMSRSQFYRKMTALTGMPPAKYIRNYRLHHAYQLLTTQPNMLVSDVMNEVGYIKMQHFSQQFKTMFGITPQEAKTRNN